MLINSLFMGNSADVIISKANRPRCFEPTWKRKTCKTCKLYQSYQSHCTFCKVEFGAYRIKPKHTACRYYEPKKTK